MPDIETSATRELDRLGIAYRQKLHNRPVQSLMEAAEARGLGPEQIVRSLLFRTEDGSFVLVLMPGPSQVDWGKLRGHLGVSRVRTAHPDEVEQVTGYPPGAVSPFGLNGSPRILADPRIQDHEEISLGAGIKGAGLILPSQALLEALDPELVDLHAVRDS